MFQRRVFLFIGFFLLMSSYSGVNAQVTSGVNSQSQITISAQVSAKEIPMNRNLTFTVKVEWSGDFNRFQIGEVETPVVENFEIYGTSVSDKRSSENGVTKAAKLYEFTLKPTSLGMGYIEGVVVKYIDLATDEPYHMMTNRLNVKVIESVPEPGESSPGTMWLIGIGLLTVAAILGALWWMREMRKKHASQQQVKVVSLEEEFLTMLRQSLDLKSPNIRPNEAFAALSKILRKYLSQKYDVAAMESTTDNIIRNLQGRQIDPAMLTNIEEILNISDLAKFAGTIGERGDLDRIYTLIETILEKNLAEFKLAKMNDSTSR
ncbi:MAG: BatD family protein [Candidatus Zhuqueibacterota bacterium]